MAIDYKDKIRKLLALAESPNENEAREAMLRAQELMAKHKLSEADLNEPVNKKVIVKWTEITCSKRREPWIAGLGQVVADNYCCYGIRRHEPGKQTQSIGFVGLADDVEICTAMFVYAVDSVRAGIQRLAQATSAESNSYGIGFVQGMNQAFKEQKSKNAEWGLVLVKPKEVSDAVANVGRTKFRSAAQDHITPHTFRQGFTDGKQFDPTRRLKQ